MNYDQFKINIKRLSHEALSDIDSGKLKVFIHDEEELVGPLSTVPIRKPRIELIIDTNQKGEGGNLAMIEDYYRICPDNFTVNIIPKETLMENCEFKHRGLILAIYNRHLEVDALHGLLYDEFLTKISPNALYAERNMLEEHPDFWQLIPYTVIRNRDTGKYYAYQRTDKVGEQRLAGKVSIGFGGHIDFDHRTAGILSDYKSKLKWEALYRIIKDSTNRELEEEVTGLPTAFTPIYTGIIYTDKTEVDRVHLGILLVVETTVDELQEEELKLLGEFTIDELLNSEYELENWTRIALETLKGKE